MSGLSDRQAKAADDRRRAIIRDYTERNLQHKKDVAEKNNEQADMVAYRTGTERRFWLPEDVPDLPMSEELLDLPPRSAVPLRSKATAGEMKLLKVAGILLLLFVPLAVAVMILATWPNLLSVLLMLAVLVAEAWFLLRSMAKGIAAKRARAAERKARRQASAQRV